MTRPPYSAAAASGGVVRLGGVPTTGVPGGGRIASFSATAVRSASDNWTASVPRLASDTTVVTAACCGGGATACRGGAATFTSAWTALFEALVTVPTLPATATTVAERCIPTGGAGVGSTGARLGVCPGARLGGALPIRFPSDSHPATAHAATPPSTTAHCAPGTGATESRGLTRRPCPPLPASRLLGPMRRIPSGKA